MVGKVNTCSQAFLKLLFQAVAWANIADNAATSPITVIVVSLHTADPTVTAGSGTINTQNASETNYTSYARVSVTRNAANWPLTSQTINPAAAITFPAGTGGAGTVTHFGLGKTTGTGATELFYAGTVTPNITVGNGITPQLTTATAITEA
jgi:hypothetical protein